MLFRVGAYRHQRKFPVNEGAADTFVLQQRNVFDYSTHGCVVAGLPGRKNGVGVVGMIKMDVNSYYLRKETQIKTAG